MDRRDAEQFGQWYDSFDAERMEIAFQNDDDESIIVPARWEVCSLCDGRGSHVNPSIDSHGLTSEDFAEDPFFAEDYFGGIYDVSCYCCNGRTTEPAVDRGRCAPEQLEAVDDAIKGHYDMLRDREREMKYEY